MLDPQFQGQIKERLNSRDALRLVSTYVKPSLELWLSQHVDYGKKLADLVIRQAQTRQRASQKVEKRKGSGVAVLPGKLTDCESRDITPQRTLPRRGRFGRRQREDGPRQGNAGDPAAARQGAQRLGGRARPALFANNEIHDIAVAIGVDPHGAADKPDLSGRCGTARSAS